MSVECGVCVWDVVCVGVLYLDHYYTISSATKNRDKYN